MKKCAGRPTVKTHEPLMFVVDNNDAVPVIMRSMSTRAAC